MTKTTEQRLEALERLVVPFIERQEGISFRERKILELSRQIARIKCAGYYVAENGGIIRPHPDQLKNFQYALEIEIGNLGIELMGTDGP